MDGTRTEDVSTIPFSGSPAGDPYGAVPVLLRVPRFTVRTDLHASPSVSTPPPPPPQDEAPPISDPTPPEPPMEPEPDDEPDESLVFGEVPNEAWQPPRRESPNVRHRWQPGWQSLTAAAFILLALWLVRPAWRTPPSSDSKERPRPVENVARSKQPPRMEQPPRVAEVEPTSGLPAPVGSPSAPPARSQPAAWNTWPERPAGPLAQVSAEQPEELPSELASLGGQDEAAAVGTVPESYPTTHPETSRFEYPPGEFDQIESLLQQRR